MNKQILNSTNEDPPSEQLPAMIPLAIRRVANEKEKNTTK